MISANKLLLNLDNVVSGKPITADIFLNDYCNNKCPYCTYARFGERNGEWMKLEDFIRYAEKLQKMGVRGMILTGGGEPTISHDFDKICRWLEYNGIPYGINTNFNVLKLIKPVYLKVSLDGWDEESYQRRRGVRAYGKTVENIKRYVDWKRENGVRSSIGIQLTVDTIEEIEPFYEANKGLDVDYIVFRPIESTLGSFYKGRGVAEELDLLRELKKSDDRVAINYKWDKVHTGFDKCYAHDMQIAINQRGEVMYCCHKPYEIIGNLLDYDILDKVSEARTDMSKCDIPCRLTAPNEVIREIEDNRDSLDGGFI